MMNQSSLKGKATSPLTSNHTKNVSFTVKWLCWIDWNCKDVGRALCVKRWGYD